MFVKTMRMRSFIATICLVTGVMAISNVTPSYATPSPKTAERPQDNLLKTGDKVNVTVEGEKDLSTSYTIDKAGEINMPLIGKLFVAGKTPHEARILIVQKLKNGYLNDPDVAIKEGQHKKHVKSAPAKKASSHKAPSHKKYSHEKAGNDTKQCTKGRENIKNIKDVKQHKKCKSAKHKCKDKSKCASYGRHHQMKHVYVVGAVNNPGYYMLPADAGHILNVVALAGGYTKRANKREFDLVRDIDGAYYRHHAKTGALKYHNGDILVIE